MCATQEINIEVEKMEENPLPLSIRVLCSTPRTGAHHPGLILICRCTHVTLIKTIVARSKWREDGVVIGKMCDETEDGWPLTWVKIKVSALRSGSDECILTGC